MKFNVIVKLFIFIHWHDIAICHLAFVICSTPNSYRAEVWHAKLLRIKLTKAEVEAETGMKSDALVSIIQIIVLISCIVLLII